MKTQISVICLMTIISILIAPNLSAKPSISKENEEVMGFTLVEDDVWIPFLYMFPMPVTYAGTTNSAYYVRSYLGTPTQSISSLMDGGLDLFNVYGEDCSKYPCQKFSFYNSMSYTFEENGTALNYTYGGGSITVTGNISNDYFSIAGMSHDPFNFGLITNIDEPKYFPNVSSEPINAIFGFAYPTEEYQSLSLVHQFAGFNEYLSEVIGIWLPNSIYDRGQLALGGADPSRYNGDINYIPLLTSSWASKDYYFFWSNIVDDVLVNGVSTNVCTKKTCYFFIDLAGKPMDLANALPEIVVDSSCSNIDELPTISLIINSVEYSLSADDYVIKYVSSASKDGIQCESGISSGGKILYPFTLGYTFIRNFYTVLDYENQRFGFANAV